MSITSIGNAKRTLSIIVAVSAALATVATGRAQTGYRPTASNLAARDWFQDARFGLFRRGSA